MEEYSRGGIQYLFYLFRIFHSLPGGVDQSQWITSVLFTIVIIMIVVYINFLFRVFILSHNEIKCLKGRVFWNFYTLIKYVFAEFSTNIG